MKSSKNSAGKNSGRRRFLRRAASVLAISAMPVRQALSQAGPAIRMEWQAFRNTPAYASFIDTIGRMRANGDIGDPASLAYWANIHRDYCPHSRPYFLAWHRGYLTLFERQLQTLSGNSELMLPYWNFYQTPMLPWEFIDQASGNPLYMPRANINIRDGLQLFPFDAHITNFERGAVDAFESLLESAPHDSSHNLIGGRMNSMQAPMDPIFWIFHCNIDRLWHAWASPDGKGIPWKTDDYWLGVHQYGPGLSLPRNQTWYPGQLGYDYSDLAVPTALPPVANAARLIRVQAPLRPAHARVPVLSLASSPPREISVTARSLGGVRNFALKDQSVSICLPVSKPGRHALLALQSAQKQAAGAAGSGAAQYGALHLVLDDVAVINLGSFGGFFYQVYLGLPKPGNAAAADGARFIGTVGPFEIAAATHHGPAQLRLALNDVLARMAAAELDEPMVSFIRVSGANAPRGETISVGEMRLELLKGQASEHGDQRRPRAGIPAGKCYC
jgi:tyrosinase